MRLGTKRTQPLKYLVLDQVSTVLNDEISVRRFHVPRGKLNI